MIEVGLHVLRRQNIVTRSLAVKFTQIVRVHETQEVVQRKTRRESLGIVLLHF